MFALEPGVAGAALSAWARDLVRPCAVLVVSPHWETEIPTIGTASQLATLHDFSGFDPQLFEIHYPACGSAQAAAEVGDALTAAGIPAAADANRGLDHGAWVPLRYLFPEAECPIVPLSIQHQAGPQHAYRIGQALAPLTQRGWLIVASGNITHNLGDWQRAHCGARIDTAYAQRFADWVHREILRGETAALLDYRQSHGDALRAHPRDEHLLPLFTALGAAGSNYRVQTIHRGISDHVIAMDSYAFTTPLRQEESAVGS